MNGDILLKLKYKHINTKQISANTYMHININLINYTIQHSMIQNFMRKLFLHSFQRFILVDGQIMIVL